MVGTKLSDKLGNNLFQYAFIFGISKRLRTSFYIHNYTYKWKISKYFKLRKQEATLNKIFKVYFFLANIRGKKVKIIENIESPQSVLKEVSENTLYKGFFQSGIYFEHWKNEIKTLFSLKEPYIKIFESKYKKLFTEYTTIVIHFRLTDYVHLNFPVVPMIYYTKFLDGIESSELKNYKIIFISDDIATVKEKVGENENYLFESNEEIVDFQLIQNADIACISNSTFAWWAAFLNQKPNKKIYGPKYWFGFEDKIENPAGIMSENWNWIEF